MKSSRVLGLVLVLCSLLMSALNGHAENASAYSTRSETLPGTIIASSLSPSPSPSPPGSPAETNLETTHEEEEADALALERSFEENPRVLEVPTQSADIHVRAVIWDVLENALVKDLLWAYGTPSAALFLYLHTYGAANVSVSDVPLVLLFCLGFNGVRFVTGELLAYILSSIGPLRRFFLYENGTLFQSTRLCGIDLVTCTAMALAATQGKHVFELFHETPSEYVKDKLRCLGNIFGWVEFIRLGWKHVVQKFIVLLCPFNFRGKLLALFGTLPYFLIGVLFAFLVLSKYLGPLVLVCVNGHMLYSRWKHGITWMENLKAQISSFVPSLVWILTLLLNDGGPRNEYPPAFYPAIVHPAMYDRAHSPMMFVLRDLLLSMAVPFVVLTFAYNLYETWLLDNVPQNNLADYPKFEGLRVLHFCMLLALKMLVTLVQRLSAFVMSRHWPFLLHSSGAFSINWRLGGTDQLVLWYYGCMVAFSSLVLVVSPNLKDIQRDKVTTYLARVFRLSNFQIDAIVENPDGVATLSEHVNIVYTEQLELEWMTGAEFLRKVTLYLPLYGVVGCATLYGFLSLMPKYIAALVLLALSGFLGRFFGASYRPDPDKPYLFPGLAVLASGSVPLAMNYDVEAVTIENSPPKTIEESAIKPEEDVDSSVQDQEPTKDVPETESEAVIEDRLEQATSDNVTRTKLPDGQTTGKRDLSIRRSRRSVKKSDGVMASGMAVLLF
jgi:hypothetical protein